MKPNFYTQARLGVYLLCLQIFICTCNVYAEKLPIKTYTAADGLGSGFIAHVYCDSRGFIWASTRDGLSRFDGYRFVTYGTEHGLPNLAVSKVVESPGGVYFVQTNDGEISGFQPAVGAQNMADSLDHTANRKLFVVYPRMGAAPYLGPSGTIWAGGGYHLFRFEAAQKRFFEIASGKALLPDSSLELMTLLEDRAGNLWIGMNHGLLRRAPDGRTTQYELSGTDLISAMLLDREDRLWIGVPAAGLIIFKPDSIAATSAPFSLRRLLTTRSRYKRGHIQLPSRPGAAVIFDPKAGLPSNRVHTIFQSSDGRIWVGTAEGLIEFTGQHIRNYTTRNGLCSNDITALAEDHHGNLWIGSSSGLMKMPLNGFITYTEDDGLGNPAIHAIQHDGARDLYAVSLNWFISRFDGRRFVARPVVMPKEAVGIWATNLGYLDHLGKWWLLSDKGLARLPSSFAWHAGAPLQPEALYTLKNGLPGDGVFHVFEDSHGDIWVSTRDQQLNSGLARWERATGTFYCFTEVDGLPQRNPASAFCEDRYGNFWFGFYLGGLARYRQGHFTFFDEDDGVPQQFVTALHVDRAGQMWMSTNANGISRIEDLDAATPRFMTYTVAQGLASNNVRSLTEDEWGRLYLGTVRGVDRFDPQTGLVKHYTTADGLAGEFVQAAACDRQNRLWFGTPNGLSCLIPVRHVETEPPPIVINRLEVAGNPYPLSELGETNVPALEIEAGQKNIQIEFLALSFASGEKLKYQYCLEGADRNWCTPTEERVVNYANLAPGKYRFEVRAVSTSGKISSTPAVAAFTILPPIWQRWWFIALSVAFVAGVVIALERLRVQRLLEIEKVRARIATDLHDDIGAGLTHIGLLSEITLRQYQAQLAKTAAPSSKNDGAADHADIGGGIERMGGVARELSAAMSDVVWSINPKHDSLAALLHRLTNFATEICKTKNISLNFEVDEKLAKLKLNPEVRRSLLLIAKEALNNAVKYSGSESVTVRIEVNSKDISLIVEDRGCGFDPSRASPGNGLPNMRSRAVKLRGTCEIAAAIGQGARVAASVPYTK